MHKDVVLKLASYCNIYTMNVDITQLFWWIIPYHGFITIIIISFNNV